MATLRQIFTKMANDVKKYPNIVQLTKTLDEGFKEVAENISGGGGGGSTVSVTQTQTSGNKIGTVTVDGAGTDLYAPKATLSLSGTGNRTLTLNTQVTGGVDASAVELPVGDTVSYVASQESGTLIGTLTINNVSALLYAPTPATPYTPVNYSETEQNTGIKWIDGKDIYVKTVEIDALPSSAGSANHAHGISNLGDLINCVGIARWADNAYQCTFDHNGFDNNLIYSPACFSYTITPTNIVVTVGTDRHTLSASFTLWYTKSS